MSKNEEIVSAAARDDQNTDSVFDFLYHDARRIGSFLAQFDPYGHLQQVTSRETASKVGKRGYSLKIAGSVPPLSGFEGAEGSVTLSRDGSGSGGSEAMERTYDPLWANALALLDYLDGRGLVQRDLTAARLGQFVIASGKLSVLDATMLPKIWEAKAVREKVTRQWAENARLQWEADPKNAGLKSSQRDKAKSTVFNIALTTAEAGMEIIANFPHSVQCTIAGAGFSVWSTLNAENMVSSVADLSLKHGTDIPGEWHLLGVLDAQPSEIPAQAVIVNTGTPTHMGAVVKNFANLGRTILGRAPEAYGMTALLLFREVLTTP